MMEHNFWHERWAVNKIGFHQEKVNSRLTKFWQANAHPGAVLVPLCGKSLDMCWLADAGYPVLGVEIAEVACRDFYLENALAFSVENDARFVKFDGGDVKLWCGDFFALTADDMNGIKNIYDRAALIALPKEMREEYAAHLAKLLPVGGRIFLIGMEYDERKMTGPPFSVLEAEVRELFAANFSVDIITQSSGPDIVGNLAERGLDTLNEKVYLLERI